MPYRRLFLNSWSTRAQKWGMDMKVQKLQDDSASTSTYTILFFSFGGDHGLHLKLVQVTFEPGNKTY